MTQKSLYDKITVKTEKLTYFLFFGDKDFTIKKNNKIFDEISNIIISIGRVRNTSITSKIEDEEGRIVYTQLKSKDGVISAEIKYIGPIASDIDISSAEINTGVYFDSNEKKDGDEYEMLKKQLRRFNRIAFPFPT